MLKEKLQTARTNKGYTQAQLAEAIHTTTPNYCRKEKGEVKISQNEWKKLADFLDVSLEEIYDEEEAKVIINTDNQTGDNYSNYNNCNFSNTHEEMIKHIMDYLNVLKLENEKLKEEIKALKN